MKLVRRYRRVIMLVFGLMALAGIGYGFLRRVGVDALEWARPDEPEAP